MDMTSNWSK